MASYISPLFRLLITLILITSTSSTTPDNTIQNLTPSERESVYQVLESINSGIDWRSSYPDDLCDSGPHGITCDYFKNEENGTVSVHVTELSIGYISDSSPNPTCSDTATFASHSLVSLTHLRKLFFYRCFTRKPVSLSGLFSGRVGSCLEELVLIENPGIIGSFTRGIVGLPRLKKLVLIGTGVSGRIPDEIGNLLELEQITLSRNRLSGNLTESIGELRKLKVLDLGFNSLTGNVPETVGNLTELVKLDLGSNRFTGRFPETCAHLKKLVFLDLSHNRFGRFGIPACLAEMVGLREVYLSGNEVGGKMPEIWEKLGGLMGLGLSGMGLVGNIPRSMGVFLRNLSYLGLDNNRLEGTVPEEFGLLEEKLNELNLAGNMLSGKLPFSGKFFERIGGKLKVEGNVDLCVNDDDDDDGGRLRRMRRDLKVCNKKVDIPNAAVVFSDAGSGCSLMKELELLSFSWFLVSWVCFGSVFSFAAL